MIDPVLFTIAGRTWKMERAQRDAFDKEYFTFGNAVARFNRETGTVEHIPLKDLPPDLLGPVVAR